MDKTGLDREERPPPPQAKLPSPVCPALPPGARLCPAGKPRAPHPWARQGACLAVLGQGAGRGGARCSAATAPCASAPSRPRGPRSHSQDRRKSSRWLPRGLRTRANTHLRRCRTSRKCLSENTGQEPAPGARSPGGVPMTAAPAQHTPLEPKGRSPWPMRGLGSPGVLSGGTSLPRGAQCQPAPSSCPSCSVVTHTHADRHACTWTCTHTQILAHGHAHPHRRSHMDMHTHADTHGHACTCT